MSKDMENVQGKKSGNKKSKMTIFIIILAALFIAELYLMINRPTDYMVLGVVGLVMLCFVYWIIDLGFKIRNDEAEKSEKEYENLFKSQRMSYLLMKDNFEDMYVILKEIEENSDIPIEDLIESQKAVAKVTIHRSKENATALMNSNDQMIERLHSLEEKLTNMEKAIEESKLSRLDEMTEKILSSINTIENAVKEEIQKNPSALTASEEGFDVEEAIVSEEEIQAAAEETEAPVEIIEDTVQEAEETIENETAEPVVEEITEEEKIEIPELEPQASISNDPNHVMTPEEIAKLIGETNAEPEPEPVVEEKPPMPDMSNPNHVMTPDEIAALLANM
ncbi:MAG: hypothetical protein J6A75_01985 [Lachnospiraceae bacterium]|nr:hypothetical protein [Lachnospiraceae bacterium]